MQGSARPGAWRVRAKTEGGVQAQKGIPTGGGGWSPSACEGGVHAGRGPEVGRATPLLLT
jgi:hypothetical protein